MVDIVNVKSERNAEIFREFREDMEIKILGYRVKIKDIENPMLGTL